MGKCAAQECVIGRIISVRSGSERPVVDGVHIGPIMHTSRAVNALWSTCSRRRSHRSDNA